MGDGSQSTVTDLLTPPPVLRSVALTVEAGPDLGRSYTTDRGRCDIGAHRSCDLQLEDPTVSRFHCCLELEPERVRIIDRDSRNGTFVDGVRIREALLRVGCSVQLGNTTLSVHNGPGGSRLKVSQDTRFGGMVGESVAMRATFALLERAAGSDATVLIEGETGTGKTLAARSIHERSPRRDGPFIVLDCGAVPERLLESELFGHERGAFTGADERRVGALEAADTGTLFLDEIGELPLGLQPKLLSALDNNRVRRIGSGEVVPIDVRIIAATNRDLREEVNQGKVRPDLYFRIAVLNLELPPLRRRGDDILVLSRTLLASLGADETHIDQLLSAELQARLLARAWPGNVRELRNYLQRWLIFGGELPDPTPLPEVDLTTLAFSEARDRAYREFERNYLVALLEQHGRVSVAAEHAGIDRSHFYRLLRRNRLKP